MSACSPLWRMGVLAIPDAGLDTIRCIESVCEVAPDAGLLWLLVLGMEIGVCIDCCGVADRVELMRRVISAKREFFCEDDGVEFWPLIIEATELPPWKQSLSPACTERCHLGRGCWQFPQGVTFCWFWWLTRLCTFHMTRFRSGWESWQGIVW